MIFWLSMYKRKTRMDSDVTWRRRGGQTDGHFGTSFARILRRVKRFDGGLRHSLATYITQEPYSEWRNARGAVSRRCPTTSTSWARSGAFRRTVIFSDAFLGFSWPIITPEGVSALDVHHMGKVLCNWCVTHYLVWWVCDVMLKSVMTITLLTT